MGPPSTLRHRTGSQKFHAPPLDTKKGDPFPTLPPLPLVLLCSEWGGQRGGSQSVGLMELDVGTGDTLVPAHHLPVPGHLVTGHSPSFLPGSGSAHPAPEPAPVQWHCWLWRGRTPSSPDTDPPQGHPLTPRASRCQREDEEGGSSVGNLGLLAGDLLPAFLLSFFLPSHSLGLFSLARERRVGMG